MESTLRRRTSEEAGPEDSPLDLLPPTGGSQDAESAERGGDDHRRGRVAKLLAEFHYAMEAEDEAEDEGAVQERMAAFLRAVIEPDQVFEIRALGVSMPTYRAPHVEFGFFSRDSIDEAAEQALRISEYATGTYFLPNPIQPAIQARSHNRLRPSRSGDTAADGDVVRRRYLFVDCDPKRPAGISSTKEEAVAALIVAKAIRQQLRHRGWPDPIFALSGNGSHLLYGVDLPADDGGLIRNCLAAIEAMAATDRVGIDTAVHNPSRLVRLYGTRARKGDDTPERPHRRSQWVTLPDPLLIVPRDLLEDLAAGAPEPKKSPPSANRPARPATTNRRGPARPDGESVTSRAAKYLDELPDSVSGEHGHDSLFRAACALVIDFDLPVEDALPILAGWNERKAHPPWGDRELRRKLDEAARKRDEASSADPDRVGRLLRQPGVRDRDAIVAAANPYSDAREVLPVPRPIRADLAPVPVLEPKLIPAPFRRWLADVAERVGCPLEYVVIPAIIAVATIVGRGLAIRPKKHDDWTVFANVWGAIVGQPGELKTPAMVEALKPLNRLVAEAEDRYEEELKEFEARAVKAKLDAEAARDRYKAAVKAGKPQEELDELAACLEEAALEPPVRRRYIVNDPTVEKLVELFRENPNGLLLYRDELTGWLRTLDKNGHESDRAFYLESWNGNGAFTSDRIGRGTVRAEGICLSLLGGIQPGPLARYLRAAERENGKENDGLVPRLQLLVYPDPPANWKNVDREPDRSQRDRAYEVFRRLQDLDPLALGAEIDEQRGLPPYLRFAPDAQAFFDDWRCDLENAKLRSGDEGPLMVSHLAKYRSLMPSLALLFHLIEVVDGRSIGPVSLRSARIAAAWCDFLEAHARRVYQAAFEGDPEPARRLAAGIQKGALANPFTPREAAQKGWSGLETVEDVERAVAVLDRLGWVRSVEVKTGGRPSMKVFVNPRISKGSDYEASAEINGG